MTEELNPPPPVAAALKETAGYGYADNVGLSYYPEKYVSLFFKSDNIWRILKNPPDTVMIAVQNAFASDKLRVWANWNNDNIITYVAIFSY